MELQHPHDVGIYCADGDDGPVFDAPWQAQAFSITVALHDRKLFSWPEWAEILASTIRQAELAGQPATGENYYSLWLAALERIVVEKQLLGEDLLAQRRDDWEVAARNTPHGMPILLYGCEPH